MSKNQPRPTPYLETCTEKCKLKDHGKAITSSITKCNIADQQLACFMNCFCKNYAQVLDSDGRNVLQMAASCGRRDLCCWLIKAGKADINVKDQESGYTPLHRSIFYGHINIAVTLIEMGAQCQTMDKDDLMAGDHAMKDRLIKNFSVHNPCQVYAWGSNYNYTLGTGNQQSRSQPELLDYFRKKDISINQVAMDKFHSVFVSSSGRAWACGHGQGGRLGVDSEQTVLTPQLIKTGTDVVVSASVGRNHTILLMESGAVWTCGSNDHHVLGHNPPSSALFSPRPINPRLLKAAGGTIIGISAARYSSVIWSEYGVLTFGLNGGQLGHLQNKEKTIITPKQVAGLNLNAESKCKVVDVAASVGATVICVSKGEIYLLHNYQTRRIVSKKLGISKVRVFGGELNSELDQKLSPKGGEELKVVVLTSTGEVLLWQESFPNLTRCVYSLKRSLTFNGIQLCLNSILLFTNDGEAYLAQVKPKTKKIITASNVKTENMSFNQFIEKQDCHQMSISRVPHIHRAVNISADSKGQNFVVIQEHPKVNLTDIPLISESEFNEQLSSLLKDAHSEDSLHDVLIEVGNKSVPAHHFVLAMSSEEFANLPQSGSVTTLKLEGVDVQVLDQVLCFAYTHDCDIIHPGSFNSHNIKGDIIKGAYDVAKKLRMSTLMKCLQLLRFEDGVILLKGNDPQELKAAWQKRTKFERTMFPSLYDVVVTSSDGATFKAHKCVLAARLEYFNSMFTGGWLEASKTTKVNMPIPQTVLREVLDFLYSDEAPMLIENQDVDYISSVLVVSDQFFIKNLKQICEVALSGNISLRNTAYLLQLAITYGADQLKNSCMQFISLNLGAVLEGRVLEILDNKTLEELSHYYRDMIPAMSKRVITPFSTQICENDIIELASSYPVSWLEELSDSPESIKTKLNRSNPSPIIGIKKAPRQRKRSESQRKRIESVSSNSDLDSSFELSTTENIDFKDLVERKDSKEEEKWVTVDKAQKTVLNRLKVIVTASSVQPTPQEFTRLEPGVTPHQHPLIQDNAQFPQLSTLLKVSSPPKSSFMDMKRSPMVKLSQKQRKKLQAEGGVKEEEKPEVSAVLVRTPWATINRVESSLLDIMRGGANIGSPPNSEQGQELIKFVDIMADEIQQRDNLSKMKSKSLHFTQIEDKAMEDLRIFYNAAKMFDERITVERVLSANIAKPMWITSRH